MCVSCCAWHLGMLFGFRVCATCSYATAAASETARLLPPGMYRCTHSYVHTALCTYYCHIIVCCCRHNDVYQYLLCRCIIPDKISRTFLFLSVTLIQELVKHRSRADPVDARCSMNPPTKPMETTRWGSQHSSDSAANLPAHAFRLTPHA